MTKAQQGPVRYAVVGLGHIAQNSVLPAFAQARNSELTALVSGDPEKLRALGERYGVTRTYDYAQFAECLTQVDAVYICTPNTDHVTHAVAAAEAGVHVLCEKPLATSDEDCRRMLAARDAGGVKFMTAYRLHFEPTTLAVIDLARSGRLGDLRYFSSSFSMQTRRGGIRTRAETGGGALWDIGIYCINAARMLFDAEPERVAAFSIAGTRSEMPEVDETTAVLLHFSGDRLASFVCSFDAAEVSSYQLVGTKGQVVVDPGYQINAALNYTVTIDEKTIRKKGRKVDQFAAELVYFSRCIVENRQPEPSAEEGAWDAHIIRALYASIEQKSSIDLPPFTDVAPARRQVMSLPAPGRRPLLVNVQAPHE